MVESELLMSTKIWVAYRLKKSADLWPFVHDVRLKATAVLKRELEAVYAQVMGGVDQTSEPYLKALEDYRGDAWRAQLYIAEKFVRDAYKVSDTSPERNYFDFDVSIGIRQFEKKLYIIPYCDMRMKKVLDFLRRDRRLEDYHYQNQTDKPKRISNKAWEERARVWNGMDAADQWQDVLVLDICRYNMFYQIDPVWDMCLKRRKAEKLAKS